MLFNYFKIGFRQLLKNKVFSAINIFGLTVGFLCFMLVSLYVHDELSFDLFHRDASRIYRVLQHEQQENGDIRTVGQVSAQIAWNAKAQIPEIDEVLRTYSIGRVTMGNDPALRNYERTFTADSNFFQFFDFVLLTGNNKTALSKPNSIVLSESTSTKYFGNKNALGKTIWVNGIDMEITGVMKDTPLNSNLNIPLIFSNKTWLSYFKWMPKWESSDWTSNGFTTYIKLKPTANIPAFENKLTSLVKDHYGIEKAFKSQFMLQALADIHVNDTTMQGNELTDRASINPFYIYMFVAVGFLILLIACLNYMNLSTAAAFKRTREIGTRKTLGAQRTQLIMQFTGEALLLSVIALILAYALLQLLLPYVNSFTQKNLQIWQLNSSWIVSLVLIMLGTGILSALYPAFIIARVSPSVAMKKEIRLSNRSLPIRKVLIVAQFSIAIIMITSTIVIYNQLQFMRQKEIGVSIDDLVVVDINSRNLRQNFEAIKNEFNALPEVSSVSVTSRVPGEWKDYPVASITAPTTTAPVETIFVGADKDFFQTFNIKLLEGRNFSDALTDSSKIILSTMAVEQLGLTDPIGQVIEIPTVRFGGQVDKLTVPFRAEVIGVIDNFHFESLREKMMPMVIGFWNNPIQNIDYYTLKVNTTNMEETITKLRAINTKFDQENPLEYTFLSNRFQEFYHADAKRGQVFLTFSAIIILIACLGLFALVSYSVESRTKEIGVRKVLGASVQNIVSMVSKEFLMLIIFACVVAVPVSYFFMKEWLKDFAYRIPLGAESFILAGMSVAGIAFITISLRTLKAATDNPVKSLRSE